jgi:hypothetical protein
MTTNKFEELKNVAMLKSNNQLLILGTPKEDDENHNCDAMGCNSVEHVLFRFDIPYGGDSK